MTVFSAWQVPQSMRDCGGGRAPVVFFEWFPKSSDNVPWVFTLISRIFPCAHQPHSEITLSIAGAKDALGLGVFQPS